MFPYLASCPDGETCAYLAGSCGADEQPKPYDTDWSLADLYHPDFMPQDLRRAHKELDKAVLKLYGLKPDIDEMDIVRHLLGLYKRYLMGV